MVAGPAAESASFPIVMAETPAKAELFTVTEVTTTAAEGPDGRRRTYEQYVQPCLAELFGTTLFVFVGCASGVANAAAVLPAVAHGLALGVLIMVLGQIR